MARTCQCCTQVVWTGKQIPMHFVIQDIVAAHFVNWLDSSEVAAVVAPSSAADVTLASIGIRKALMRLTRCVGTSGSNQLRGLPGSGFMDPRIFLGFTIVCGT